MTCPYCDSPMTNRHYSIYSHIAYCDECRGRVVKAKATTGGYGSRVKTQTWTKDEE